MRLQDNRGTQDLERWNTCQDHKMVSPSWDLNPGQSDARAHILRRVLQSHHSCQRNRTSGGMLLYHWCNVSSKILQLSSPRNVTSLDSNLLKEEAWLLLFPIFFGSAPLRNICVVCLQLLSYVQLFVTPWTSACQVSLSFTISQSLCKFMSIESVIPQIIEC